MFVQNGCCRFYFQCFVLAIWWQKIIINSEYRMMRTNLNHINKSNRMIEGNDTGKIYDKTCAMRTMLDIATHRYQFEYFDNYRHSIRIDCAFLFCAIFGIFFFNSFFLQLFQFLYYLFYFVRVRALADLLYNFIKQNEWINHKNQNVINV